MATKFKFASFLLLLCVFVFPHYALALEPEMYEQTTVNTSDLVTGATGFQQLLGQLTGVLYEVDLQFSAASAGATGQYGMSVSHCDNSGMTVNCASDGGATAITIPTGGYSQAMFSFPMNTPLTFDPTKYYKVIFSYQSGTQHALTVYGSSANTYSGGVCQTNAAVGFTNTSDCWFVLYGVQTAVDVANITSLSPYSGSTTAATYVPVSFNYHATNAVTGYLLAFKDLTAGSSWTQTGSLGAGDGTVSQNVSLTSGHGYSLSAFLTDASGNQVGNGAGENYFTVVKSFASTSVQSYFFSTSTLQYDSSGNLIIPANATSTGVSVPGVNTTLGALGAVGSALCTRFPFSYICDFDSVIAQLNQTGGSSIISIALPSLFGSQASSSVVLLNEAAIPSNSPIFQVRTVIDYSMWLAAGFLWIRMIFKVM